MLRRLLLTLPLLAAPLAAEAASFACDKAQSADETAICAERSLNDLDVEMAVRFGILKDVLAMGNRAKLQEDQEAWLAERRTCAADIACLRNAYEVRLTVLRGVLAEFTKQGAP